MIMITITHLAVAVEGEKDVVDEVDDAVGGSDVGDNDLGVQYSSGGAQSVRTNEA